MQTLEIEPFRFTDTANGVIFGGDWGLCQGHQSKLLRQFKGYEKS